MWSRIVDNFLLFFNRNKRWETHFGGLLTGLHCFELNWFLSSHCFEVEQRVISESTVIKVLPNAFWEWELTRNVQSGSCQGMFCVLGRNTGSRILILSITGSWTGQNNTYGRACNRRTIVSTGRYHTYARMHWGSNLAYAEHVPELHATCTGVACHVYACVQDPWILLHRIMEQNTK